MRKIQDREGKVIFKRDTRACNKCKSIQSNTFVKPILPPEGIQVVDPNKAFPDNMDAKRRNQKRNS